MQETSQSTAKVQLATRGFSIVEALLASTLFLIVAVAFAGAIIYGEQSAAVAGQQSRAAFLAEEAIQAVRNIRDESFGNLIDGNYGLYVSGGQWMLSGDSDSTDGYVRQVQISTINVDPNRKLITVAITWQQTPQRTGNLTLSTELTNWSATPLPPPSDCNSYCISMETYISGICRQNGGRCGDYGETYESGGDPFCPHTGDENACCCVQ
jgi:Tfp pilus assembly protein PilV